MNLGDEDLGPMLQGWELRRTGNGRVYFVDHRNRTTQFTDPRLSANIRVIQEKMLVVSLYRSPHFDFTVFSHPIADLFLCWGVVKHSFIH